LQPLLLGEEHQVFALRTVFLKKKKVYWVKQIIILTCKLLKIITCFIFFIKLLFLLIA
jgi:hypothetical protein